MKSLKRKFFGEIKFEKIIFFVMILARPKLFTLLIIYAFLARFDLKMAVFSY